MRYLLQTEKGSIRDIEVFQMKELLNNRKYFFNYLELDISELEKKDYSECVPIGDIFFIQKWLKLFKGVDIMTPIEVPKILREEKYLGRTYEIFNLQDLKLEGYCFLKDIEHLKRFSYLGRLDRLDRKDLTSNLYLKSSVVDIKAEYRVFVSELEIKAIQFYDGDCTIFPNISILKEMITLYYLEKDRPKSYTMDIAVLNNSRTIILEVHPVVAVGTYGYYDYTLLRMYEDGINYYVNKGKYYDC